MHNHAISTFLAIAILISSTGEISSADFNKGLTAARNGDFLTALREWTPLAEGGDATAQINLGVMYEDGKGVKKNYESAVKWYRLAAEQGDVRGQINLGLMYARGEGVALNYMYAHMWWNIAASTGDKDAASNRDLLERRMTASDISAAQQLSHECIRKNYKKC